MFADRHEAGRALAALLRDEITSDTLLLALPRGGVPVAYEIALAFHVELDVWLVRKLGAPWSPELAAGAIAAGGITVYNDETLVELGLEPRDLEVVRARELEELRRRERVYRGERPLPAIRARPVILVDDGIATGSTMEAAVASVRAFGPRRVVVAVPAAPPDVVVRLKRLADAVVCVATPEPYIAVGAWYRSFPQLADDDVVALLEDARERIKRPP